MPSHKCRKCDAYWPTHMNLKTCPECNGQLVSSASNPMDSEEAARRKIYADFEEYWEHWTPENADPRIREEAEAEVQRRLKERRELEECWKTA